jgi:hypothetical protein
VVAAVDENTPDKIKRLLRAGSDKHIVRRDLHAVAAGVPGDHLAQRGKALRGPVLQGARSVILQHVVTGFREFLDGEHLRRWKAAC